MCQNLVKWYPNIIQTIQCSYIGFLSITVSKISGDHFSLSTPGSCSIRRSGLLLLVDQNLGDRSNHQIAPRFQERIQPHWDRTLFSLITTSRHLKTILKRIKPIMSKSYQIYNCKLMKLHKFGKTHWKKTTWMFIEVIMVMRIQRPCLWFTLCSSFLVDFQSSWFTISNHKIIKSLKSNGRNPNRICFLLENSDINWMFV